MNSFRRRLMLLILTGIGLVWVGTLVSSYRQATHEVNEWEDARLQQAARTLLLVDASDLNVLAKFGFVGSDDYGEKENARLLFEVRNMNGRLLAASSDLPPDNVRAAALPSTHAGAYSLGSGAGKWNVYAVRDRAHDRDIRVFESSESRSDLAAGVARRIARPLAFALPVLALLVWLSIGGSLAPLKALSVAIRSRNADNLDPIDMRQTPSEVRPLLDALNSLLARMRGSIERERAFTADAAHELKSPLAGIKVQAQVALAACEPAQQHLAMQRVVEGVDRSTHLANELLLLARIDEAAPMPLDPLELNAIARRCIGTREAEASKKHITVALVEEGVMNVKAEAEWLRILINNLLENAIKYGRHGGRVEVLVRRAGTSACLLVRDDGPGVSAENRVRLSDRFFRVVGNGENGSGLGLSIVARIAARFGATLAFMEGIEGRGLGVVIEFPVS